MDKLASKKCVPCEIGTIPLTKNEYTPLLKENHHPNMHIYYKRVVIDLSTHSVSGLSENDFIMAAKVESII